MIELTDWVDYLEARLNHGLVPRRVEVYRNTASTQDIVKARSRESLLVLADQQTQGRGRFGRRWHAPPGTAVLMSFTHQLDPRNPTKHRTLDHTAFLASLGVARAIETFLDGQRLGIKWPNDLVVHGRKLAGILVETIGDVAIIGVGINVNLTAQQAQAMPPDVPGATSLAMLGHEGVDRVEVAAAVVEQIDRLLHAPTTQQTVNEWRDRSVLSNQTLKLRSHGRDITGTVLDLDPDEGLILRRDSGEIIHLPAATTTVLG